MNILCGDIGGTKTRLTIIDLDDLTHPISEESYASNVYGSLTEISSEFLKGQNHSISYAAFGIAGPVLGCSCKTTNLPWKIDANQIKHDLKIPSVHLLNDLEATAFGISALSENDFFSLQTGLEDAVGNRAIIAAGTGLGQAGMFWNGDRHVPFATEGGHCSFAPGNELECALLSYLQYNQSTVCWEDILSGSGLISIYSFLLNKHQIQKPNWFLEKQKLGDLAQEISMKANDGEDHICVEAMKLFCQFYGTEAGNLALKIMATGGVYIGGGIAPKILNWLQQPQFIKAFCNKGKMRCLMESIPVRVILNDRAALYGPALYLKNNLAL